MVDETGVSTVSTGDSSADGQTGADPGIEALAVQVSEHFEGHLPVIRLDAYAVIDNPYPPQNLVVMRSNHDLQRDRGPAEFDGILQHVPEGQDKQRRVRMNFTQRLD